MKEGTEESISDHPPQPHWAWSLVWPGLVLLGLVVFELTAQPALGVAVVCVKFGWNDFLTARWLWRIDPDRNRGRTCLYLYLSSGLWKMAGTGLVLLLLIGVFYDQLCGPSGQLPGPNIPFDMFTGAFLVALAGFGLSITTAAAAIWVAGRHRVKLWLSGGVHGARRKNLWPSLYPPAGSGGNSLFLWVLAILLSSYFLGGTLLLGMPKTNEAFLRGLGEPVWALVQLCSTSWWAGGPFAIWACQKWFTEHLTARNPAECWGWKPPRRRDREGAEMDWVDSMDPSSGRGG